MVFAKGHMRVFWVRVSVLCGCVAFSCCVIAWLFRGVNQLQESAKNDERELREAVHHVDACSEFHGSPRPVFVCL